MPEIPLEATSFAPLLNSEFEVLHDQVDFGLTLLEVDSQGEAPAEGIRVPFTLVFGGPADRILAEGRYILRHADAGDSELHVMPIMSPQGVQHYQVIIN